ncbi:MAG TPA: hypothetical protein VKD47_04940, partial [Miltoncostaeaceae bacterium]|nr:hypothetical protein [Miltoncostaeaceae bacterium]
DGSSLTGVVAMPARGPAFVAWDHHEGPGANLNGLASSGPGLGDWLGERFADGVGGGYPPLFAAAPGGRAIVVYTDNGAGEGFSGIKIQERDGGPSAGPISIPRFHAAAEGRRAALVVSVPRRASLSAAMWRVTTGTMRPAVVRGPRTVGPGRARIDLGVVRHGDYRVLVRTCAPISGCSQREAVLRF